MHTTWNLIRTVTCLAALTILASSSVMADEAANAALEKELIAVLRSDGPAADKAIACKKLAIYGSSESVTDLAKLLSDPQLASWARIALEAIPGTEADAALRTASEPLEGRLLIGVLNSIGVRRDAGAVAVLKKRLEDQDADVASAAAVALGHIGNDEATQVLRSALVSVPASVRSAVAEGCVLCAERLHAGGKSADAVAIYDEVRKAEVPQPRILEATRGAILARQQDGIPMLLELFQSNDKAMFNIGLSTTREFPGNALDKLLPAEVARVTPGRGALLILAMADRKETVVVPAIVDAAANGSKPVKLAAIGALARVGDVSSLPTLLDAAVDPDAELAVAAKATLADLPGKEVDAKITSLLNGAKGKMYPLLLGLIGQRRIEATAALLKALDHSDKEVRTAALVSLGETVSLNDLSVLITQALTPKNNDDAEVAQQALKTACVRMPDREACASQLASALDRAAEPEKPMLLEILSDVGGEKALNTIGKVSKSKSAELQDVGSRLLGKWSSLDAAPVLLDLAKTGPAAQYRIRALRGYIGLARKFPMPEPQRVEMCQNALDISKLAEQKLVLDVLKIHPSLESLKLAVKVTQGVPELKDEGTQSVVAIAQKLGTKGPEVAELLSQSGIGRVKLEIIKAEYGSGTIQKDVTAVLQKQASEFQLVTLPKANYNDSFGDPAPNEVKQLKVQYRMDDKEGSATFAENALIILPMPK
ncbi:MAG: HEAT repeat domain-containing protein [Planctomycetes bacterium]|nr:HEAT repeat domain-containing protein [Planctomycetota bacterium]